jgi:CheY-like chemotaxis protein
VNAANVTLLRLPVPATLLVVEDDVITRFSIADELRNAGYRVLEASSAEDAIAILEHVPIHLLFADIHMPKGMSGLDVARVAKGRCPAPKVILTSGKVSPKEIADLDELGPFVDKPYLPSRVLDLVRRSLDPTQDLPSRPEGA